MNGILQQITAAQLRIGLSSAEAWTALSELYQAGHKNGDSDNNDIREMHELKVMEEVQPVWASSIVFASTKNGTLQFSVDDRKLNDVTERESDDVTGLQD